MAGPAHHLLDLPRFEAPVKLLLVVAPFYKGVTDALVRGGRRVAGEAGASLEVAEVPGALEIPPAIRLARGRAEFDGFVALGCVIRGETSHYETVCNESARGLMQLGLEGYCIGNGILTVENLAQAEVRADPEGQDKGGGAAAAALHLVALSRRWKEGPKGIGFRAESKSAR
jgi:6,7-dimethyl-8-ribityllumazine synthase